MSSDAAVLTCRSWTRRRFIGAFCALALLTAMVPFGSAKAGDADEARRFIESLADQAIATLTVKDIPRDERIARFRQLLTGNFDIKTIGRWVLGRFWRGATKDQQNEYLKLFEDLIVVTYAERFERYGGEELQIVKALSQTDKDMVVYTQITRPTSDALINVDWRVRRRGDKLAIIDVIVEGVSMGQTQRSEFASAIKRDGGFDGFLAELKKRVYGKA